MMNMSKKAHTKEEIEKMQDLTDYDRVRNMSEDEIKKNAELDPDAPLQSEEDLERFKRVKHPKGTHYGKD